jgi:hypothetical protein
VALTSRADPRALPVPARASQALSKRAWAGGLGCVVVAVGVVIFAMAPSEVPYHQDQSVISVLRSNGVTGGDEDLTRFARSLCTAMGEGVPLSALVERMAEQGRTREQAVTIADVSTRAFCRLP